MFYKATIIIPVFDEINSLEKFCKKIKKTFKQISLKYIFIDDGSSDGSTEWLDKNLKIIFSDSEFKLIKLNKNYGKGYSIKQGIRLVEGDYTLFIDSDLEYEPNDLLEMFNVMIENKDIEVLYGSRNLGSKTQLRRYFLNAIAVKINTWMFNFLYKQHLTDLHTGSKIIKTSLLHNINITTNGFGLEIDLSSEIAKKNINIFEYGISYYERTFDQGKKITIIDGLLSYYYLFKSRFLKNNLETQISLIYSIFIFSIITMPFSDGIVNQFISIFFIVCGLLLSLQRKIIQISIIGFFLYLGSILVNNDYKNQIMILIFFIGIYISDLVAKKFLRNKKNKFSKYLF